MKKCFAAVILLSLLLTACTAQHEMNAEMFLERLCKNRQYSYDDLGGTPEKNGKAYAFVTSAAGARFAFGFDCDENGEVAKVGLNTSRSNAAAFSAAIDDCCSIFAPDDTDNFALVKDELGLSGELPMAATEYYSTSWYRYSLVVTETAAYFAVESKRALPDAATEYTLRVNETYSLIFSE